MPISQLNEKGFVTHILAVVTGIWGALLSKLYVGVVSQSCFKATLAFSPRLHLHSALQLLSQVERASCEATTGCLDLFSASSV